MEDVYQHMSVQSHEETGTDGEDVPARLTPQFSLAFLRQAEDPALLMTCDGRVTFLNDAACALFGLEAPEASNGRQTWELWPDPEAEGVMKHACQTAANGEAVRFPALSGAGAELQRWTVIFSPVMDADGRVESIFGIAQPA